MCGFVRLDGVLALSTLCISLLPCAASVKAIVEHGCGVIVLLSDDGRGSGFGALALSRMLSETTAAYSDRPPAVGVAADARSYHAPLLLLRNHLAQEAGSTVQLLLSSPDAIARKADLFAAFAQHRIVIADIGFIRAADVAAPGPAPVPAQSSSPAPVSPAPHVSALPAYPAADSSRNIAPPATDDGLGLALIASRIASIPEYLGELASAPLGALSPAALGSKHFVVTGLGTSEAHARYLVWLLERACASRVTASFVALSSFVTGDAPLDANATLVVFSQGISPNAQLALRSATGFRHVVVFTSTSVDDERSAGREERAALLSELQARGADFVRFPLLSEYTTLVRVIGPAAGFLAGHRFVAALTSGSAAPLSRITPAEVTNMVTLRAPTALLHAMRADTPAFEGGFVLVAPSPLAGFAQNLSFKFMEGLYWRCPQIVELLSFAHGPFQQLCLRPRPVVILQTGVLGELELVERCVSILRAAGLAGFVVRVNAAPALAVLGFEAIFNEVWRLCPLCKTSIRAQCCRLSSAGYARNDAHLTCRPSQLPGKVPKRGSL